MDIGSELDTGAAFMFTKDGLGVWNQVASMYDMDASSSDNFGFSVAVSGEYAMVGAFQEAEDEADMNYLGSAGSVYIFITNEFNTLEPLNTLSVSSINVSNSIKAYPNPVKERLTSVYRLQF